MRADLQLTLESLERGAGRDHGSDPESAMPSSSGVGFDWSATQRAVVESRPAADDIKEHRVTAREWCELGYKSWRQSLSLERA